MNYIHIIDASNYLTVEKYLSLFRFLCDGEDLFLGVGWVGRSERERWRIHTRYKEIDQMLKVGKGKGFLGIRSIEALTETY